MFLRGGLQILLILQFERFRVVNKWSAHIIYSLLPLTNDAAAITELCVALELILDEAAVVAV